MKSPKENLLVSVIINIQDTGEETVTDVSTLVTSNQSFQYTPNSPREFWDLLGEEIFPIFPLNQLENTFLQIGDESLPVQSDIRATNSMLTSIL